MPIAQDRHRFVAARRDLSGRRLRQTALRAAVMLAVSGLGWAVHGTASAVPTLDQLFRTSASGGVTLNGVNTSLSQETQGGNGSFAQVPGHSASAQVGSFSATSESSAFRSAAGVAQPTVSNSGGGATAFWRWNSPSQEPQQAGVLASLDYNITGTVSATASPNARGRGRVTVSVSSLGQDIFGEGLAQAQNNCCAIAPMVPLSGTMAIRAGGTVQMSIRAETSAIESIPATAQQATAEGRAQAQLTYTLNLIEDRRHWAPALEAPMLPDTSWVEQAAPDASSWATFNRNSGRVLGLTLSGDATWRGLIVDGESLSLDLNQRTLSLGTAGPSLKTFNVRVGEGRPSASTLTLRNGTVAAENDFLVGGSFGPQGPTAHMRLDSGLVLNVNGGAGLASLAVADDGPGRLTVQGASRVVTNVLALARKAPAAGAPGQLLAVMDVTGAGSRVEATRVALGDRGEANVTVSLGGVLQTQSLGMAELAGSRATLLIDGVGSRLVVSGGFVDIGKGGRGSLEVVNGGVIEGNSSRFTVGSGDPTLFSVMRASGVGTQLLGTNVRVAAGGNFELRDEATWPGAANSLEVKGGQARLNKATAVLSELSVEGLFNGSNLVSSGAVDIESGATVDASRADIVVGPGGRITLSGAGSRLTGFNTLQLAGSVIVNAGTVLSGDSLAQSSTGSLLGTGVMKFATDFDAAGQLRPGNSPGLLRIESNVRLTETSLLVLELAGLQAGTQHDVLQVLGNLNLQGGLVELAFIDGFAPLLGQQFVLLDVTGTFSSSADFAVTGLLAGWQFSTTFDAVSGKLTLNSLSDGVSAVPEPSTCVLMLAGAVSVVAWARRRQRPAA